MRLIITFTISFLSLSLYSQSIPVESIPFKIEKNHIYIYCKVNDTDSLKFLFDTGAAGTVINQQSTRKLNLKTDGKSINVGSNGQNDVDVSSGNEITLGTIRKKEILLTIIPYGTDEFDGVLGTDVMMGHIVEIDYYGQVINFYDEDDKNINYDGFTKLKMYSDIYPTCIKSAVVINGKKYKGLFGLDTGADDVLTFASPFLEKYNLINKMIKIGSARGQGSDGTVFEVPVVLCPEIRFAEKHLYRIPALLSSATDGTDATDKLAGFYGNAFLKKFNTIIDYKNHLIYFRLNKNLYTDFYEE